MMGIRASYWLSQLDWLEYPRMLPLVCRLPIAHCAFAAFLNILHYRPALCPSNAVVRAAITGKVAGHGANATMVQGSSLLRRQRLLVSYGMVCGPSEKKDFSVYVESLRKIVGKKCELRLSRIAGYFWR